MVLLAAAQFDLAGAQDSGTRQPDPANIDPKVTAILRAGCDKLSGAQTMAFTAVDTYERAARNGQPLYYTVLSRVTLQRPDKLRVLKLGDGVPDEFYYDGKIMAAYVPSEDLVAVANAPATIDQMLDAAWDMAGIYFPFADVMVSKPCTVFENLTSAFYVGQSVIVGGTRTDMVALTAEGVQAELWIDATEHLPRMVRVTYTNEPAHAHYQTEYSDWQLGGSVDAATFRSDKVATAKHVEFSPPGAMPPPAESAPAAQAPAKQP